MKAVVDGIAVAGTEGNNGLAAEIIRLQERRDHHRRFIPPDGAVKSDNLSKVLVLQYFNAIHTFQIFHAF